MPNQLLQTAEKGYDIILGGGQFKDLSQSDTEQYALSVFDLSLKTHQLIPLDYLAHGIAVDPNNPERLVMCEKIGPGASEVDLATMSLVKNIPTVEERYFYGHCVFSNDGSLLYATETYLDSKQGVIVIRDAGSLEVIGEFPSFGDSPHECQIINDGKTMVVTNGGGGVDGSMPNVAYIDIETRALIRQESLTNRLLNTGHFMVADDASLIVVSAPRAGLSIDKLGGVSIQPSGKKMKSMGSPKKIVAGMQGEALSVAVHQDTALVTHPGGNMLTFWSLDGRRFLKKVDLPRPRGVTLTHDQQRFVVSFGDDASVVQIGVESLEPVESTLSQGSYLTGSHLHNWTTMIGQHH